MTKALLALEDGTTVVGRSFGARGEAFGEAVFNTAMSGYQEVLTDPSYTRQVVVMTAPQVGNYGTNDADAESDRVHVAAFVVREASRRASSWRAERTLGEELSGASVVGVEEVDTRMLTLRTRRGGAMRCGVTTEDSTEAGFLDRVRAQPGMEGADLAHQVSTIGLYEARAVAGPASTAHGKVFAVAAYDFGLKRNILRMLAASEIEATVFPARTPASEVLSGGFDGVLLSNGPGDPAATTYGIEATTAFLEAGLPVFGICLGHQLLARALGLDTYKLRFGHRGANHPVKDLDTGRVEITSHNHGFAVRAPADAVPRDPPRAETTFGPVALSHWNLNDGTLEGLRCEERPAFGVQYHPEAAPGPHDSRHLFQRFRRLIADAAA